MEWTRGPVIGCGSTATVSLATSVSTGQVFALKSAELSKSLFLQKEQYFLSKLTSCPYVVKYLGYVITHENSLPMYNICMEYVPGGTLHDAISRHGGRLNEFEIRSYTRNILQGLDYLHSRVGLVHCDIKSSNVLISQGGAKIADFGCAKFVEEQVGNNEIGAGGDVSAISGTPAFMSPETARGEEQGFAADIWAVGCTIIEMATGYIPWGEENDDPLSVLYKIGFSSEIPKVPSWLSEKGQDFLRKCLIRDPKERWTAKELLDHPFLGQLELKDVDDQLNMSSPSCVLDQDFWDSMDALESPQDLTVLDGFSSSSSSSDDFLAERIKRLSGSDVPNWSFEEDWITVRSSEIDEKDVILVDSPSIPAELSDLDSVLDQQELERSIFQEDLSLEFFLENDYISSSDDSNVGSSSSSSEGYDFVSGNIIFDIDNDDKSCLLPILFCLLYTFLFLHAKYFQYMRSNSTHNFRLKQSRRQCHSSVLHSSVFCLKDLSKSSYPMVIISLITFTSELVAFFLGGQSKS